MKGIKSDDFDARLAVVKSMKEALLEDICCPFCQGRLRLHPNETVGVEIKSVKLGCICGQRFPIFNYIPRFVRTDGYVRSFSFE